MTSGDVGNLIFFLGGRDLEMVTIGELLASVAPGQVCDKALAWGAKASAYREEIETTLAAGRRPVLVELEDDLNLEPERIIIVDHHGERAGKDKPTSLHQVFALLNLLEEQWTRWYELVAANDRGYIPALLEGGATPEEIEQVRRLDRQAQGITPADEVAAAQAVSAAQSFAGGRLTVVHLPHARTATVTDRLEFAGGEYSLRNILIISPTQVNFFGSGEVILRLDEAFPHGWYGGALPARGYWGHDAAQPAEVQEFLLNLLKVKL